MISALINKKKQYYITAYGLAVQQGYEGTLEEWLDSLKGDDVELRYQDSVVKWRRIPGAGIPEGEDGNYPWQELFDVAELQGTVVAETLETATKAAEGAAISAAEAAGSRAKAQDASLKAEMEARAASVYAQEAALSAQVVGALPVTLTETDGVITADKTREQILSAINNGIQVAVKYGYFHFGLSRIRTVENILRFTLLAASEADEREDQIYLEVTKDDVWTKGTVEKGQLDGRFIAEYGVSTYADIYNAFTAGKSVYCRNGYYVLPMTFYQNQSYTARFSGTAGGEEVVWQVKMNEWSSEALVDEDTFVAEYGMSTWTEIYSAMQEGKSIFCKRGYYEFPMVKFTAPSWTAWFGGMADGQNVTFKVQGETWSSYNAVFDLTVQNGRLYLTVNGAVTGSGVNVSTLTG